MQATANAFHLHRARWANGTSKWNHHALFFFSLIVLYLICISNLFVFSFMDVQFRHGLTSVSTFGWAIHRSIERSISISSAWFMSALLYFSLASSIICWFHCFQLITIINNQLTVRYESGYQNKLSIDLLLAICLTIIHDITIWSYHLICFMNALFLGFKSNIF